MPVIRPLVASLLPWLFAAALGQPAVAGRPIGATGAFNTAQTTYASGFVYAPHGAAANIVLGNGVVESTAYNSNLQPTEILAQHTQSGGLLDLDFGYGTVDNGNIVSQTVQRGATTIASQTYAYLCLCQLKS